MQNNKMLLATTSDSDILGKYTIVIGETGDLLGYVDGVGSIDKNIIPYPSGNKTIRHLYNSWAATETRRQFFSLWIYEAIDRTTIYIIRRDKKLYVRIPTAYSEIQITSNIKRPMFSDSDIGSSIEIIISLNPPKQAGYEDITRYG